MLDDVFAELDGGRRDRLAELVGGAEQVLVTAAVPEDVPGRPGRRQVRGIRRGGVACLTTADRARLAREALDAGRRPDAARPGQSGPARPARSTARTRAGARATRPRRAASWSARPRRDDPQPLSAAIDGLIDARGWRRRPPPGSVFGRWAQIVGPDLAAHTRPDTLADGELTVTADSTAWATQVRLLAAQLVRRLNAELGDGTVQRVKVRGPASRRPARRPRRMAGARGPRAAGHIRLRPAGSGASRAGSARSSP